MTVSGPEETLRGSSMSVSRAPELLIDLSMSVSRPMETGIDRSMAFLGAPETLDRDHSPPFDAPDGGVATPFFPFAFGKSFSAAARPCSLTCRGRGQVRKVPGYEARRCVWAIWPLCAT
jgi:hypothetical protein